MVLVLILFSSVLILVLMEDTLRVTNGLSNYEETVVLILVLMEDTLRGLSHLQLQILTQVLILVLMEDTLREITLPGSRSS